MRPIQRLPLLILLRYRLERDAFSALASEGGCFTPLAASSTSAARRLLAEAGGPPYLILADDALWPSVGRHIVLSTRPLAALVLRKEGDSPPRCVSDAIELRTTTRDTPWMLVVSQLLETAPPSFFAASDVHNAERVDPAPEHGEDSVPPPVIRTISPADRERLASLTRRERQVLEAIAGGGSVRECAESLGIAESTVDNHKSRLMRKVGVRRSLELIRFAYRVGVAP